MICDCEGTLMTVDDHEVDETRVHVSLLRFLACGSVDDGKSTLIGRLLHETNSLYDDELAALAIDSQRFGTNGADLDYALLLDGLHAEREQGITIDVAYRYFATSRRKFIVADCPGHTEYTRNMASGASTSDLSIVLVDAKSGITPQTRRHTYISALLGIRNIIFAINKMDLVNFDQSRFHTVSTACLEFSQELGVKTAVAIPVSAKEGDNVTAPSGNTPWYKGKTLLEELETAETEANLACSPFRLPVQLVLRPNSAFRGFAGQIASGKIAIGDQVVVATSGVSSSVKEIINQGTSVLEAHAGSSITLVLEDEIDVSRGSLLYSPRQQAPHVADQLQAHLIWFDSDAMIPGRGYVLQTENDSVNATVTSLRYELDLETFAHEVAKSLPQNGIGVCNLSLQRPIAFDVYRENRVTGNFILIDRVTNATVGAGLIDYPLQRAFNVQWQNTSVTKAQRSDLKAQTPTVIWFTGLSGSGKSTIANALENLLHSEGKHTYLLDGDNLRHGLNRDLGFTAADRVENIRRIAETAKLMADAGLIVLVASISPFAAERRFARELMGANEFIEVFVDTPITICAERDPKGLYKKAASGELHNFTGISSPYEAPLKPEIRVDTTSREVGEIALEIRNLLTSRSSKS